MTWSFEYLSLPRPHAWRSALLLSATLLGGCAGRPLTCGEYPAEGGPAIIRTRDQQICESVRLRVIQHLMAMQDLDLRKAEKLYEKVTGWRRADTLDELYTMAEKDGGPEIAAAIRRAVESVRATTTKPVAADCAEELEACLTAGAVKGAELAMGQRAFLVQGRAPTSDGIPAGARSGGIDIEEMSD